MSHKCLNRRRLIWFFPLLVFLLIISGCEGIKEKMQHMQSNGEAQTAPQEEQENSITLTSEIVELEDGFPLYAMTAIMDLMISLPAAEPPLMERLWSILQIIFFPV